VALNRFVSGDYPVGASLLRVQRSLIAAGTPRRSLPDRPATPQDVLPDRLTHPAGCSVVDDGVAVPGCDGVDGLLTGENVTVSMEMTWPDRSGPSLLPGTENDDDAVTLDEDEDGGVGRHLDGVIAAVRASSAR
jgi:hypothetical protein